jgi:hypothetical protein
MGMSVHQPNAMSASGNTNQAVGDRRQLPDDYRFQEDFRCIRERHRGNLQATRRKMILPGHKKSPAARPGFLISGTRFD